MKLIGMTEILLIINVLILVAVLYLLYLYMNNRKNN